MDYYWEEVLAFFKTQMVPKYKELLTGSFEGIEAVQGNYVADDADFWEALETLFLDAVSHPDEVSYLVGIINPVFYIFMNLCYGCSTQISNFRTVA